MILCDTNHEEIVHNEKVCPLCKLMEDFDYETEKLQTQIDDLTAQLLDLEKEEE